MADMAVEIAVRAFGRAKRPMHIDAETRFAGIGQERGVAQRPMRIDHVHRATLRLQSGFDKAFESAGAMRQSFRLAGLPAMLLLRAHLAEGNIMAERLENRVVAETGRAA